MDILLNRLTEFIDRGGPQPNEYEEISSLFDQLSEHTLDDAEQKRSTFIAGSRGAFNSLETNQGFVCARPHGYFGDFEIIDRIYTNHICADPQLARWDEYFHWSTAPRAVRARKDYCKGLLRELTSRVSTDVLPILNVASGPCRDIYEFLVENSALSARVNFHCIDQDARAIEYAKQLLNQFVDKVSFQCGNVFRLRLIHSYQLVWCAGLFDYLEDRAFIFLLKRLALAVAPGGLLVVGNFSRQNIHRNYMAFGGWRLIHRDKNDLLRLFNAANIPNAKPTVDKEPNGINLFLRISIAN